MTQRDLGAFGARGLANAEERARVYEQQLKEIHAGKLRRRFLNDLAEFDMAAKRLMKYD